MCHEAYKTNLFLSFIDMLQCVFFCHVERTGKKNQLVIIVTTEYPMGFFMIYQYPQIKNSSHLMRHEAYKTNLFFEYHGHVAMYLFLRTLLCIILSIVTQCSFGRHIDALFTNFELFYSSNKLKS